MLYYKEGERLSELASFVREGSEQLVEVRWKCSGAMCIGAPLLVPAATLLS